MKRADGKSIARNLVKWAVVLAVLVAVFFWKKPLILSALAEIRTLPVLAVAVCLALSAGYQLCEGGVIAVLSGCGLANGVRCALFYAFYKLITLGSGSGVAEVYYLSRCSVPPEKGAGLTMLQYAVHKTAATVLGIAAFFILLAQDGLEILPYKKFILAAIVVSLLISAVFVLAVIFPIAPKSEKIREKIGRFSECGRELFKDWHRLLVVMLIDVVKLCCWFAVPAVVFRAKIGLSPLLGMTGIALASMTSGVMVSPSGAGTLEYVFSLFFAGLPNAVSAAAIILYRFFTMIVPFLLGVPVVAKLFNSTD